MAKNKGILKTLAVGVLAVGVIGAGIGTAYHFRDNIKNWFDNIINPTPTPTPTPGENEDVNNASSGLFVDGNYIENESINFIPETVMFTTSGNVANVSNVNMIGYQLHLNCSVEPSYATNKKLNWSFALVDGTDASVDPYNYYILDVSDNGYDVTVTCKEICEDTFILRCQSADGNFTKDIKLYCAPTMFELEYEIFGNVLQRNIDSCLCSDVDYSSVKNGLPYNEYAGFHLTPIEGELNGENNCKYGAYYDFVSFFDKDDDIYQENSNYCVDYLVYQYNFYHAVDDTRLYFSPNMSFSNYLSEIDSRYTVTNHYIFDFTDGFKIWAKSNNYLDFINQHFSAFSSIWSHEVDNKFDFDDYFKEGNPTDSNYFEYCLNLNLTDGLLLQNEALSAENYYKAIRIFNEYLKIDDASDDRHGLYDIYIEGGFVDSRNNQIYLTSSFDLYFNAVFVDKALVSDVKITNSSDSISGFEGGSVDKPYYIIGKREEQ